MTSPNDTLDSLNGCPSLLASWTYLTSEVLTSKEQEVKDGLFFILF